jgi:metal-responsive CopG/Arc/MetJ family transcriptional regulator
MERTISSISLPSDLLAKVDQVRGDVPRSTFIRRLLEQSLKSKKKEAA